jgi:O-6-methylguanine DNA methyltransferase
MLEPAITFPHIIVFAGALAAALAGLPAFRQTLTAPRLGLLLALAPLSAFSLLLTRVPALPANLVYTWQVNWLPDCRTHQWARGSPGPGRRQGRSERGPVRQHPLKRSYRMSRSIEPLLKRLPPAGSGPTCRLNIVRFHTPLSPMTACASSQGVCLLEFTDNRRIERELKDLVKRLNADIQPATNPHLDQLQTELKAYFDGQLKTFSVPLHTPGTAFQQAAWKVLRDIPYGETRSYKQQAVAVGNPQAVRAVAAANGQNRVSIVIPCHRVIGADGSLTGYGGGLDRKSWLLDFERARGTQIRLFDD